MFGGAAMKCEDIKKFIPIYLDKELEPKESQIVKDHLAVCPGCRQECEAYERSWHLLGELEDIQPEPNYIGRFWTKLAQRQTWSEKLREAVSAGSLNKQLAPAVVMACLILLVVGISINRNIQVGATNQMLAQMNEEELIFVENIELAENLDVIEEIDFLEDLDLIESLDV